MPEESKIKAPDDLFRNIDFQVDTLANDRRLNGVYDPSVNTVTITHNRSTTKVDSLPHEQKHRDNQIAGMYEYPVSDEQAYKLDMHDEISANIASLLELRQKYIQSGDLSAFDYNNGGYDRYSFYKEAIAKGEIKPNSPYKEDFDREMAFIVNGTRNMWERDFASIYLNYCSGSASYYGDHSGKYAQYHNENYQRAMKIAYTMGGVDFTQYMDRDVEIPQAGKYNLFVMEYQLNTNAEQAKLSGLSAYDGSMSLQQYQKLLYHQLTIKKYQENGGSIETTAETMLRKDRNIDKTEDDKFITDYVNKSNTNKFVETYNSLSDKEKACITAMVNTAAKENAGSKALSKDNNQAYQKALDNAYSFDVNLKGDVNYQGKVNLHRILNCDQQIEQNNTQLSKDAEDYKNISSNRKFKIKKYLI